MSIDCDVNAYLDYVDGIVEESNMMDIDKKYYKKVISFFKVTGRLTVDIRYGYDDYTDIYFDDELYLLFEFLSLKFYNILNYHAWRKRKIYKII